MRSTGYFTSADDGDDGDEGKDEYFCSWNTDSMWDSSVVQVKYVALPKKGVKDSTTSLINVALKSTVEMWRIVGSTSFIDKMHINVS